MAQVHRGNGIGSARGMDAAPSRRPGVPMELMPRPFPSAPADPAVQQPGAYEILRLGRSPSVTFGTGVPTRRLSGAMRRAAYRVPEHRASRWLLLLAADRCDLWEHRLGRLALMMPLVAVGAAAYLGAARLLRVRD